MSLELPKGRCWNDVERCGVRWDEVHLRFKDGSTATMPFTADISTDTVDYERPVIEVYADGGQTDRHGSASLTAP
jgi:hypothetical protein